MPILIITVACSKTSMLRISTIAFFRPYKYSIRKKVVECRLMGRAIGKVMGRVMRRVMGRLRRCTPQSKLLSLKKSVLRHAVANCYHYETSVQLRSCFILKSKDRSYIGHTSSIDRPQINP